MFGKKVRKTESAASATDGASGQFPTKGNSTEATEVTAETTVITGLTAETRREVENHVAAISHTEQGPLSAPAAKLSDATANMSRNSKEVDRPAEKFDTGNTPTTNLTTSAEITGPIKVVAPQSDTTEEEDTTGQIAVVHIAPQRTSRFASKKARRNLTFIGLGAIVVTCAILVALAKQPLESLADSESGPKTEYHPIIVPVANTSPMPTSAGIEAKIGTLANSPDLAPLGIQIADAGTGTVLWEKNGNVPLVPASTLKILTASAALLALPINHRLTTSVVQGPTPGTVVLVGGGDPTLTTEPGDEGFYPGAAHVSDLAKQVLAKNPGPITKIIVDDSLFSGPTMAPTWQQGDIAGGFITPITPLMVDAGRLNPNMEYSPRTSTPDIAAGKALAAALGVPAVPVETGIAPQGAKTLSQVFSAPLETRLRQALQQSDNVLAAEIGMEVAAAQGRPVTLDGSVRAVIDILDNNGIDVKDTSLADTNGLSMSDRISPAVLEKVLVAAAADTPVHPNLRLLLDLLPVAGETGTLAGRFTEANNSAAGYVRAKTGTLDGANALAGIVKDTDNRNLVFVLISNNATTDILSVRTALDSLAANLHSCGCVR